MVLTVARRSPKPKVGVQILLGLPTDFRVREKILTLPPPIPPPPQSPSENWIVIHPRQHRHTQ